ncbi:unnamed protein product [Ilex paraguariensis]|uniref:RRM domain-containing protein n=1 Tax=Ilex paraguariensis TaxID=185542 RepID=A0ABC8S3M7_9AQUA
MIVELLGDASKFGVAKSEHKLFAMKHCSCRLSNQLFSIEYWLEKSSTSSREEDFLQRRDEHLSSVRGSPFLRRDFGAHHSSPEPSHTDKSKMKGKNMEPSEVLWIGFPASLKVDALILRRVFSPFGEIESITVFPGGSYAFIQFKNVMAACWAKDTLRGKLFGDPRVRICFAKREAGTSNRGRNLINAPHSPHFRSYAHPQSSEDFRQDRNFGNLNGDPNMISLCFICNMDPSDPDVTSFNRKDNLWAGGSGSFEQRRFQELGSEPGLPGNMYEHHSSCPQDSGPHFRDSQQFPRQGPSYNLPEDALLFHGAKKLKTSSFPPEDLLPNYPFSDSEQAKHVLPRMYPDFTQPEAIEKNFHPGPFGYKQIPDHAMNLIQPFGERSEHWNASYDSFQIGSLPLASNPTDWKRSTPKSHQSSLSEEWKWEGTIAKGGTAICRARCFPVGKALDMNLPEFLDCTARTSLDILTKHYYQAASVWVVFFVPADDPNIEFYNEFMDYLRENQRAALVKLYEKTTLFLVPPSEFAEKVLKVPGKLSISGVILRLERPGSNFVSLYPPHEKKDTNSISCQGDESYPKPSSSARPYSSVLAFQNIEKPVLNSTSFKGNLSTAVPPVSVSGSAHAIGKMSDSFNENRHEYVLHLQNPTLGPNWSPHNLQNSNSGSRSTKSDASNSSAVDPINSVMHSAMQQSSSTNYSTEISGVPLGGNGKLSLQETKPPVSSSLPVGALHTEQLAQLTSSLLGQQRQSGGASSSTMHEFQNSYRPSQQYTLPHNQVSSELPSSYFDQMQQQQQQEEPNVPTAPQRDLLTGVQVNQQPPSSGAQEEVNADTKKRLLATLQLAAALLQQTQQGGGT